VDSRSAACAGEADPTAIGLGVGVLVVALPRGSAGTLEPGTGHHGAVGTAEAEAASDRPTKQAESWAITTVLAACRSGHLELDEAEARLHRIFAADTLADLYAAIEGVPHPPAPLVLATPVKRHPGRRRS
jgi:hypothetical protein